MGLKHKAIHAMLANPHLSPFELIDKPCETQDWTLIDHLVVIHKVKESDYIDGDPQASIANMARTLASAYLLENAGSGCVVLVKDGAGAPKPAVREKRDKRPPAPHIDFCKRNMNAIEYNMMKLLADLGMKNKLFLVTGAKANCSEDKLTERGSISNLVSFHQRYLDYQEFDDDDMETLVSLELPGCDMSNHSYIAGSTIRPEGVDGVFVVTFAEPETCQVSILHDICKRCSGTEADVLLVELANALQGSVTICTGDSDLVAVLTACGREGITLRMENKSYHKDRDMHMSPFGELLFAPLGNSTKPSAFDLSSSENRFRALCDITAEEEHMLPTTREQHAAFEDILDKHSIINLKDVARYLYLAGIRGSLYCVFLSRFFKSRHQDLIVNGLGISVHSAGKNTVRYIFESLCPTSNKTPQCEAEWESRPSRSEKRKLSCLEDHVFEFDLGDGGDGVSVLSKEEVKTLKGLKRLSKSYMDGKVSRGSHGRFLRLCQAGRHLFMRIKFNVIQDETERMSKLFFMTLCGTDYNAVPTGLGVIRLMAAVVTNHKSFSYWCKQVANLMWGTESPSDSDYHYIGVNLASITKVPMKIQSKHWTEANCGLMVKTMKYAIELWNLKRPRAEGDYGLSMHEGKVHFDCKTV